MRAIKVDFNIISCLRTNTSTVQYYEAIDCIRKQASFYDNNVHSLVLSIMKYKIIQVLMNYHK